MKLYECNSGAMVRLLSDLKTPPFASTVEEGQVVKFLKVDGMYSMCKTEDGNIVHPAAWTEVEIVK